MARTRLELRRLLDPRPHEVARFRPIRDAVSVPLAELPERAAELPPKCDPVAVAAAGELLAETRSALARLGRDSAPAMFDYASEPPASVGRLWRPSEFLEALITGSSPGKALELGCGAGRNAVYLASLGWRVHAVDRLPDALDRARRLERAVQAAVEPVTWICADLRTAWRPLNDSDFIVMSRFWNLQIVRRAAQWLKPGGRLLVEAVGGVAAGTLPATTELALPPTLEVVLLAHGEDARQPAIRLLATKTQ